MSFHDDDEARIDAPTFLTHLATLHHFNRAKWCTGSASPYVSR